jgi:hypothetical protein
MILLLFNERGASTVNRIDLSKAGSPSLQSIMAFVQALLSNPAIPAKDRQKALDRAFADPGLPSTNPTSSFWLRSPHPDLAKVQSATLPSEADVVIIGSGVTGTSIARTLLNRRLENVSAISACSAAADIACFEDDHSWPLTITLALLRFSGFEKGPCCSGATGRNGGHILETAEEFADLEDKHGPDAAKKIMRFRLAHLREMLDTAEEYGLTKECQARRVQFLSVYFDEDGWEDARERVRRLKPIRPNSPSRTSNNPQRTRKTKLLWDLPPFIHPPFL